MAGLATLGLTGGVFLKGVFDQPLLGVVGGPATGVLADWVFGTIRRSLEGEGQRRQRADAVGTGSIVACGRLGVP